ARGSGLPAGNARRGPAHLPDRSTFCRARGGRPGDRQRSSHCHRNRGAAGCALSYGSPSAVERSHVPDLSHPANLRFSLGPRTGGVMDFRAFLTLAHLENDLVPSASPLALFGFLFETPLTALLVAAGAAAVPVIVHLLNRKRFRVVNWA